MTDTWRNLIKAEMHRHKERWEEVVDFAPKDIDWDKEFDSGYGESIGEPFTLWTYERVYFPTVYDGSEDVASIPRNPCNEVTQHIGGE